jgi:hypothetical protein
VNAFTDRSKVEVPCEAQRELASCKKENVLLWHKSVIEHVGELKKLCSLGTRYGGIAM